MLKIKDATGEVIGVLNDEDSVPKMKKIVAKTVEDSEEAIEEGEEEDANADNVNV